MRRAECAVCKSFSFSTLDSDIVADSDSLTCGADDWMSLERDASLLTMMYESAEMPRAQTADSRDGGNKLRLEKWT